MSEKVVISNELAELIEKRLDNNFTKDELITWHLQNQFRSGSKLNLCEGNITTEDLAKALYIGYTTPPTLDTTKFDNLSEAEREEINSSLSNSLEKVNKARLFSYEDGYREGILKTLGRLGIKLNEKQ
ncbi:hypothetical protein [Bacillus sp. Bos-x628]|uniref:hypothetical protein n=1 Tax=Bacillus maqinnsis TaxID=3229854 RepID=UPI00338D9E86